MSPENGYLTEYYDDVETLEEAKDLELREGAVRTDLKVRLAGDRGATEPDPTEPSATRITRLKAPKIIGATKVAQTLRATRGSWDPKNVTVKFRWFIKRGKKAVPITGAKAKRLRLTKSLRGERVRVRVAVTKRNHLPTRYTTTWTKRIRV